MADTEYSFFRPRRGKKSAASGQTSTDTEDIILKRGEVFFEVPEDPDDPTISTGSGIGKIKMGDGVTAYSQLPYFTNTEDDKVGFTDCDSPTVSSEDINILNNIKPSATLKTLFTNIKQLLYNLYSEINNNKESISNNSKEIEKLGESVGNGKSHIIDTINRVSGTKFAKDPRTSFDIISADIETAATNIRNNAAKDAMKGNALQTEVLSGKTFTTAAGINQTGTMPNNGTVIIQNIGKIDSDGKIIGIDKFPTIPSGYHNGRGEIKAERSSYSGNNITPGRSVINIPKGGVIDTPIHILGDSNLVSSNILTGKSIFNVSGSAFKPKILKEWSYPEGIDRSKFEHDWIYTVDATHPNYASYLLILRPNYDTEGIIYSDLRVYLTKYSTMEDVVVGLSNRNSSSSGAAWQRYVQTTNDGIVLSDCYHSKSDKTWVYDNNKLLPIALYGYDQTL